MVRIFIAKNCWRQELRTIKIGKRGGGLAFRIPKALVEKYKLKVGDSFDPEAFKQAFVASRAKLESKQA
jgi:antitoxin component of MazEF toxin-antitoxin module